MKRSFLFLSGMLCLFSACMKDSVKEQYTFYRPQYRTHEAVRNNIKSSAPVAVVQPGKIVVKGNYLFMNEVDKGIHVIDISNPSKPVVINFIAIPGCVDLAINGTYLYADCYTDLVTLDITDPANVSVKQFLSGVFPQRYYPQFRADTTKIISEWIRVDTVVSKDFNGTFNNGITNKNLVFMSLGMFNSSAAPSASYSASGAAIAGSMARFALQNSRLYTVSNTDLKVFNVTSPASPSFVSTVAPGQGNIETIFPYKNNLFIGAQAGMFIYDASNPDQPKKYSQFIHARSCDPVVADDKYAYVTLSSGSLCVGYTNQLEVIDITSLSNPSLVKVYELTGPRGLSKDGNLLLICDGKDGLKIFDAKNASQVTLLKQVPGFNATDVIALQGTAVVVAADGLYLVDYSNPANASVTGKIQIASKK